MHYTQTVSVIDQVCILYAGQIPISVRLLNRIHEVHVLALHRARKKEKRRLQPIHLVHVHVYTCTLYIQHSKVSSDKVIVG